MKNILQEARAKLKLTLLAKGRNIQNVSIEAIPEEWMDFGTKGDRWVNVIFPESENSSGCIYIGTEKSVFDPHIHKNSVEHMTVINVGGDMTVVTDTECKTVKYPDSIVIEKGVPHAVVFNTETKVLVMWHPRFEKGWDADFIRD